MSNFKTKKVEINLKKLVEQAFTIFGIDVSNDLFYFCDTSFDGNYEFDSWFEDQINLLLDEKYIFTECELSDIFEDVDNKMRELVFTKILKMSGDEIVKVVDIKEYESEHEDHPNLN